MLRRALKRPVADSRNYNSQEKSELSLGQNERPTIRVKKPESKNLEDVVFGADDDEMFRALTDVPKKNNKQTRKQRAAELSSKGPAWIDDNVKTIQKEGKKNKIESSTPSWAKLDSERIVDDEDADSDMEDLLQRAGDILVHSSSLPAGMIKIKKLADANVDDKTVGRIGNVEFHPTSRVILTAGTSHRLSIFQIDDKRNPKIQSIFFEDFPIHTAHFNTSGDQIIVGSDRRCFKYYDMIGGKVINIPVIKSLEGNYMSRFEVSPDGKYLIFLGRYGSMHMLCAKSKEYITTLNMNGDVRSITFSADGSKMFSFGGGNVFVWDLSSRSCIHTFIDEGCIQGTSIAISSNNQHLVCGSQSGIVNIYDVNNCLLSSNPKPLKSVLNLVTECTKTKFNCTSEILAMSTDETENGLRLIHFPSMHAFSNFPDRSDGGLRLPKCLDFSPNSGYLAIGNHKGRVLLYRLKHYKDY